MRVVSNVIGFFLFITGTWIVDNPHGGDSVKKDHGKTFCFPEVM